MGSRSEFSPQTLAVLAALSGQPSAWQHGYALARETGLKSGTLYPILIRLADRGLVEACWQDEPVPGRPRRHLYRLTADGLASATTALAEAEASRGGAGRHHSASGCEPAAWARCRGPRSAMSWLGRIATAAARGAVRLVPTARRDWAEAVWAEAHEVPAGWQRLAWRAGGLRLMAKEGQMARRIGILVLFAVAAGAAAWGAWPGLSESAMAPRSRAASSSRWRCWSACRC